MAQIVVFANHKGGCAKTTSVANVGCALGALGRRVLLIDCDPQANLGEAFGIEPADEGVRLEDALEALPELPLPWTARFADDEFVPLPENIEVLPCSTRLEALVSSRQDAGFAYALRDLVDGLAGDYDLVLLDTPPGLGPLSSMAMLAADWVVVPARPADFDIGGAVKVADLIETRLAQLNPRLRLLGVLVTQVNRRWTLRADTVAALKEAGIAHMSQEVPFMVRVGAAPRFGLPTFALEPDSQVGFAYRRVAESLLRLLEQQP